ncbi:MAG: excinuclease [Caulobacter sp.]|nr:excinuclease [Caulobacter sp.]
MNRKTLGLTAVCLAMAVAPMQSATAGPRVEDRIMTMSIQDVLSSPDYAAKGPSDIKFYFADQPVTVKQVVGPVQTSRKSSNYSGNNPPKACRWAMLSALIALAEEARLQGGNAVVGIKSNYRNVETASRDTFQCGVGGLMVGVALKGDIAVVE